VERGEDRHAERASGAIEALEDAAQPVGRVRVLGAVHGRERVTVAAHLEPIEEPGTIGARALEQQLVDHRVAADVDALVGNALAAQDVPRVLGRREQVIGQVVREDAVDLLGHAAIVGSQTRLDVPDADAHLVRGERGSEHRVRVALDEHDVGLGLGEDRLHAAHDRADLVRLRARADGQVLVRRRQSQLLEEHAVHLERVVLAGVEQHVWHVARDAGADDRRHLDDFRRVPTTIASFTNVPLPEARGRGPPPGRVSRRGVAARAVRDLRAACSGSCAPARRAAACTVERMVSAPSSCSGPRARRSRARSRSR
jgi:hypothetical protein